MFEVSVTTIVAFALRLSQVARLEDGFGTHGRSLASIASCELDILFNPDSFYCNDRLNQYPSMGRTLDSKEDVHTRAKIFHHHHPIVHIN